MWLLVSLLLWASCPAQANAHLVNSGFGSFYDGIGHLFITPEDVLAVVALALLAGLSGKRCGRAVILRATDGVAGSWIGAIGLLMLGCALR